MPLKIDEVANRAFCSLLKITQITQITQSSLTASNLFVVAFLRFTFFSKNCEENEGTNL